MPPTASLPPTIWGGRRLIWGERTYVMGILNITPDSFSRDGLALSDLTPDAGGERRRGAGAGDGGGGRGHAGYRRRVYRPATAASRRCRPRSSARGWSR